MTLACEKHDLIRLLLREVLGGSQPDREATADEIAAAARNVASFGELSPRLQREVGAHLGLATEPDWESRLDVVCGLAPDYVWCRSTLRVPTEGVADVR